MEDFGTTGLDAFVSGVGTGGTVSGVSHVLKTANPDIAIYAVEADESAVLSGEAPGPHKIQGISAGFIPDTLDTSAYDGIIRVKSDDALATGRAIGGKEGFLVGISSGAAIHAAIEVAKELGTGKKCWQSCLITENVTCQQLFMSSMIKRKKVRNASYTFFSLCSLR